MTDRTTVTGWIHPFTGDNVCVGLPEGERGNAMPVDDPDAETRLRTARQRCISDLRYLHEHASLIFGVHPPGGSGPRLSDRTGELVAALLTWDLPPGIMTVDSDADVVALRFPDGSGRMTIAPMSDEYGPFWDISEYDPEGTLGMYAYFTGCDGVLDLVAAVLVSHSGAGPGPAGRG